MTPLQEYVRRNGIENITEELGIFTYEHPTLPLVGFKYDQISSPRMNLVVRWARGTVLEKGTWNLVAQPFVRFFDYQPGHEDTRKFDWNDFGATTKQDGSNSIVFNYNDQWHMNTSGSFGLGTYSKISKETWQELFWRTFYKNGGKKENLAKNRTHVFELCCEENRVLRMYQDNKLFLLSLFKEEQELDHESMLNVADSIGIQPTESHSC